MLIGSKHQIDKSTIIDANTVVNANKTYKVVVSKLTFIKVLKSEGIKFITLKSNIILIVTACVMLVLFGVLAAATLTGNVNTPQGRGGQPVFAGRGPIDTVMSGANFSVLLMSVLGVLVGAREYSSGLIRVTMSTVPARLPVLWAKIFVFTLVALPALIISCVVAFSIGTNILSSGNVPSATWSNPGAVRAVIGSAFNLVGIGVMGMALGFLMRSIAGGLATLIGGVLILPTLLTTLLPESWSAVLKYVPSNAGAAFTNATHTTGTLDPIPGAFVYFGWIILSVVLAAVVLKKRDV